MTKRILLKFEGCFEANFYELKAQKSAYEKENKCRTSWESFIMMLSRLFSINNTLEP